MKKVAIIDFGMGNLDSVVRAIEECGGAPFVTSQPEEFSNANCIILPGVGAFSIGIKNIKKLKLDRPLKEQVIDKKTPCLGICLGMQLFASKGFEGEESKGLGWIEGDVTLLKSTNPDTRIPHIGWNEVHFVQNHPIFNGMQSGKDFYFAHSYNFVCKNESNVYAFTPYCGKFVSVVGKDNILGVQFHPEKSQRLGFQILKNFLTYYN